MGHTGHSLFHRALHYHASRQILWFLQARFLGTLHRASLWVPFFQQHLLSSGLCAAVWQFLQYSHFFIILSATVICDHCAQLTESSHDLARFSNEVFLK